MITCNEAILAKLSGAAKRCKRFSETLDKARCSGLEMSCTGAMIFYREDNK
jgi:hypothetical protein